MSNVKQKPIRIERRGIVSQPRIPYDEPLTPGLRKRPPVTAIGFVHNFDPPEESE